MRMRVERQKKGTLFNIEVSLSVLRFYFWFFSYAPPFPSLYFSIGNFLSFLDFVSQNAIYFLKLALIS